MKFYVVFVTCALVSASLSSAIPKNGEDHKSRVMDKELSEEEHYQGGEDEHNPEYDHEAFLGKDDAKTFDQLTPEESRERLGKIYEKIDKDQDGSVTEDELKLWIKHVQNRYIYEDTDRQWKEHESEGETLKWEAYTKKTYGEQEEAENKVDGDDSYDYKNMQRRDKRRWAKADKDGDGHLNKEEFADFLHPEDAEHMRDIVVDETLEDIDKDKDGLISLDEYVGDMYPNKDGDEEPDWVKTEREQFNDHRDTNKDGHMDREEVKKWIIPDDYDHSEAEAKHLITESDADSDGKLSKEEVLDKFDVFVGSQATDFGEALTRHDEF